MRLRQAVVAVMLLAAVCSLVLTAVTVRRHADAVKTIEGVSLQLLAVEVDPQAEDPLLVEVEAASDSGHPYYLESIRLVARYNDTIVGTRPEAEISDEVAGDSPLRMRLKLEPGSEYDDSAALQTLVGVEPDRWMLHGFMDVSPLSGRSEERWEFRIEGVNRRE